MSILDIKKMVKIPDFLNFLGFLPTDHKGKFLHYRSPFREDKNPSFWVNEETETCGDFAEGKIGDVINLAARWYKCDFKTAKANLEDCFRLGSFSFAKQKQTFTAAQPKASKATTQTDTSIIIKHVQPLQNAALVQYAENERGISSDTAKQYLQEVYYKTSPSEHARQFFALAFRNDKGGYELRSKYFKGSTANKAVTTIERGSNTVLVFEGFMDFLSCVEYWNSLNKIIPYDIVVLNSVAFAAQTDFSKYDTIKLLLDNDPAGQKAAADIAAKYKNVINLTPKFIPDGCKDFNDFWIKHINSHK